MTTLKQKFLLALFGFFLTLFFLEIALRLGGATFIYLQDLGNRVELTSDEYRILCLGESTTALGGANSYPSQLEHMLNERHPQKKFRVINKGMVSKTTSDVLDELQGNLDKYQPALVICMLGVNDRSFPMGGNTFILSLENFLQRFQVFILGQYLKMHLKETFGPKKREATPEQAMDILQTQAGIRQNVDTLLKSYLELQKLDRRLTAYLQTDRESPSSQSARRYLEKLRRQEYQLLLLASKYTTVWEGYDRAKKYLETAIRLLPDQDMAYVELGRCFMSAKKDYAQAMKLFYKAITLNPDGVVAYMELAQCYADLGMKEKVLEVYQKVLERPDLKGLQVKRDISVWLMENKYLPLAVEVLKEAINKNPSDYYLHEHLAEAYQKLGQKADSDYHLNKARDLRKRMEEYLPITVHNFNRIADMILERNIRLIVMQYPLKSLEPLKKVFFQSEAVIFVENMENFQKAIHKGQYAEYFADTFGGVFGHCTPLGNRLIAENLTRVILDQVVKP